MIQRQDKYPEIKIVGVNHGEGRYENIYYPILSMGNEGIFNCYCITGNKETNFDEIVDYLSNLLWKQYRSNDNYGLSFFAAGYNGEGQQNFINDCWEKFGVDVF